jgi:hypothetical protein
MREIDITKQDIRCCDDFYIEDGWANVPYELWFDVDKYFGTHVEDTNDWINFYTYYSKDGTIKAVYVIDHEYGDTETIDWELTEAEQKFFRELMENYCQKLCDCTLAQLITEE